MAGGVGAFIGVAASRGPDGPSLLPGGSAFPHSVEAVAQRVLPSVVKLEGGSGEGSGVVISEDNLILTNAHVRQAARPRGLGGAGPEGSEPPPRSGLVALRQNGESSPVSPVGADAAADLAVVRAQDASGLTPVAMGDSSTLRVGQEVVAVGSPLGLSGTVTTGVAVTLDSERAPPS